MDDFPTIFRFHLYICFSSPDPCWDMIRLTRSLYTSTWWCQPWRKPTPACIPLHKQRQEDAMCHHIPPHWPHSTQGRPWPLCRVSSSSSSENQKHAGDTLSGGKKKHCRIITAPWRNRGSPWGRGGLYLLFTNGNFGLAWFHSESLARDFWRFSSRRAICRACLWWIEIQHGQRENLLVIINILDIFLLFLLIVSHVMAWLRKPGVALRDLVLETTTSTIGNIKSDILLPSKRKMVK